MSIETDFQNKINEIGVQMGAAALVASTAFGAGAAAYPETVSAQIENPGAPNKEPMLETLPSQAVNAQSLDITNGTPSKTNSTAAFIDKKLLDENGGDAYWGQVCQTEVIGGNATVTELHCLYDPLTGKRMKDSDICIGVGADLTKMHLEDGTIKCGPSKVEVFIVDPRDNTGIALLIWDDVINTPKYSYLAKPEDAINIGDQVEMRGWGEDQNGNYPTEIKQASLTVNNAALCPANVNAASTIVAGDGVPATEEEFPKKSTVKPDGDPTQGSGANDSGAGLTEKVGASNILYGLLAKGVNPDVVPNDWNTEIGYIIPACNYFTTPEYNKILAKVGPQLEAIYAENITTNFIPQLVKPNEVYPLPFSLLEAQEVKRAWEVSKYGAKVYKRQINGSYAPTDEVSAEIYQDGNGYFKWNNRISGKPAYRLTITLKGKGNNAPTKDIFFFFEAPTNEISLPIIKK